MASTPPLEGSLEDVGLPALLLDLAGSERTGVLRIEGGGEIWLHAGSTYLARTTTSPDVAQVLYDAQIAGPEAIDAALGEPGHDDGPSGVERLLAGNPAAEDTLRRLLHEVNLNAVFELLAPAVRSYLFEDGVRHPLGRYLAEDTGELVAVALQRVELWTRITSRIPSPGAVFTLAPALPGQLDERLVTADEWRYLSRLDGRRTVADIVEETGETTFRVSAVLYRLLLEELIVAADPA